MKSKQLLLGLILALSVFLRLWRIDEVPVSLFGDELDVGYHAYSILKTGRDYYGNFMPLHFHSLAEWRTPLYIYSCVPTVAVFGISPLGVRFPAAIFGVAGVAMMYFLVRKLFGDERLSVLAAGLMAVSPWSIQYSRAGFEVTELLFFLLAGMYMFLVGMEKGKWLWVASVFLAFTPWIYSSAKLFTPIFIVLIIYIWRDKLAKLERKHLVMAALALMVVGGPIAYSTYFGGGAERFSYISVFSDPTTEPEVGTARLNDAMVRGESGEGISPRFDDRMFHNKFVFWGERVLNNYLSSVSTEFLFFKGDPNPRHSIEGMGQLYKVEIVALLLGLVVFFGSKMERKNKILMFVWIVAGILPASLTRDGGNHATRLILMLPPLLVLTAYGIRAMPKLVMGVYILMFIANFIFYQHNFWVHNPWQSERWWHSGFGDAVYAIEKYQGDYEKVVISTAGEPPWIFFAAWSEYPPDEWQKNFPVGNDVDLEGFGRVSHIGKYYFGSVGVGLYEMGGLLDGDMLYLATAKEVNVNLAREPMRTPEDLKLLEAVTFPSGEPAYYLFTAREE